MPTACVPKTNTSIKFDKLEKLEKFEKRSTIFLTIVVSSALVGAKFNLKSLYIVYILRCAQPATRMRG